MSVRKSLYKSPLRITGKLDQPLLPAEAFQQTVWHSCRMVNFLEPQGAVPPGFNPLGRGSIYCLATEAPLFRGMPTEPEAFLGMPDASGPLPCTWTHLKKALRHTCPLRGAVNKYRSISLCFMQRPFSRLSGIRVGW